MEYIPIAVPKGKFIKSIKDIISIKILAQFWYFIRPIPPIISGIDMIIRKKPIIEPMVVIINKAFSLPEMNPILDKIKKIIIAEIKPKNPKTIFNIEIIVESVEKPSCFPIYFFYKSKKTIFLNYVINFLISL